MVKLLSKRGYDRSFDLGMKIGLFLRDGKELKIVKDFISLLSLAKKGVRNGSETA